MQKIPLISIVVPVYNVEKYLRQCVDSLIDQTLKDIEIILVDDGASDLSPAICDEYAKKDDRVVVIHQKNSGLSDARNSGTEIAKGKYLTYLDADDWVNVKTCEVVYAIAEEKQLDLVMWQMIKEYEDKTIIVEGPFGKDIHFEGQQVKKLHRRVAGPIENEMQKPQLIDSFLSAWGKLYRLDIIKNNELKFVDTKIIGSEDILFNFEYFGLISNAYYLHNHLIHYRKDNLTSLTKTHGSTLFPRFLNLFSYLENEIKEKQLPSDYQKALNNRVCISMMNIGLSEVSPRNKKSLREKINALNLYLSEPRYSKSYKTLSLKYFPFHWKVFYLFCKLQFGTGVFWMLKGMRLFVK
ncbi:MAG: glycosyltransferase family 2 protein [Saprospiraceae bacterium]